MSWKAAGQRYLGIELKQLGSAAIDQILENCKEPQDSKQGRLQSQCFSPGVWKVGWRQGRMARDRDDS